MIDFVKIELLFENRFIVQCPGIPSYLIKGMTAPQYYISDKRWGRIFLYLYNSITPSTGQILKEFILPAQALREINIDVELLGPAGDIVQKWEIKGMADVKLDFGGNFLCESDKVSTCCISFFPTECKLIF